VIGRPPPGYYIITDEEMFEIAVQTELQGGDKACSSKINQVLDRVERRNNGGQAVTRTGGLYAKDDDTREATRR
jgi:hypothetical protein